MTQIKENITICTVNYDDDVLIQKNIDTLSILEKNIDFNWIIAQNKPKNRIKNNFITNGINISYIDGLPEDLIGSAALHHSIALNLTKKNIKTRFVVFIDPDFFFIKNNCLSEILTDMKKNNIGIIGTPWHPKWFSKFRYFPCSHCMFVDTEKIDLNQLDFRPINVVWDKEFHKEFNLNLSKNKNIIIFIFKRLLEKYLSKTTLFITFMFFFRARNGFDGDTSSRIYLKLRDSNINYRVFNPYFNISHDWLVPIPWKINRIIEYFLPERFCYFPKKKSFVKYNEKLGDFISEKAYEAFYWKNHLFGYHIRGNPKSMIRKRNKHNEVDDVDYIFNKFQNNNIK